MRDPELTIQNSSRNMATISFENPNEILRYSEYELAHYHREKYWTFFVLFVGFFIEILHKMLIKNCWNFTRILARIFWKISWKFYSNVEYFLLEKKPRFFLEGPSYRAFSWSCAMLIIINIFYFIGFLFYLLYSFYQLPYRTHKNINPSILDI